ncbi:MAG: cation transporter, partial [Chloroflexi bacterium]|nr:cation transporter [Chloroflexota bacterium]
MKAYTEEYREYMRPTKGLTLSSSDRDGPELQRSMNISRAEGESLRREPEQRGLLLAFFLTGGFLLAEVAGSLLTNSLALLADAGHMLVDVAALGTSVVALRLAQRPSTRERTFGLLRLEILAALANGVTLLLITGYIVYEAYQRLLAPRPIQSLGMLAIATLGLGVNLAALYLLRGGESLNIRSALLHVLGDTVSSVGIILGGLVIFFTGWAVVDPVLSIGIA